MNSAVSTLVPAGTCPECEAKPIYDSHTYRLFDCGSRVEFEGGEFFSGERCSTLGAYASLET